MYIKKYFIDVKKIIQKRNKWLYFVLFSTFLISYFLFFYLGKFLNVYYPEYSSKIITEFYKQDLFKNIRSLMEQENYVRIFFIIFIHNFSLSVINLLSGLTAIAPFILILANGSIIGFLFGVTYSITKYSLLHFVSLYAILLLELLSMILAGTEGLYLLYSIINPQKIWKTKSRKKSIAKTFGENIKILILVGVILLIAGVIEVFSIYYQSKLNNQIII
ncbi:MAG: stage II sporulation protein M [Candidatus Aenigmarchaeota archaeon]|nr:stage II sporulation protein M [Candidatus Aenigmarchaeota archaeon]